MIDNTAPSPFEAAAGALALARHTAEQHVKSGRDHPEFVLSVMKYELTDGSVHWIVDIDPIAPWGEGLRIYGEVDISRSAEDLAAEIATIWDDEWTMVWDEIEEEYIPRLIYKWTKWDREGVIV